MTDVNTPRVTPESMEHIPTGVMFVFGSNESGIHGAGAAHFAHNVGEARWGQGFGPAGNTFALPTKDFSINKLDLQEVAFYVKRFINYTQAIKNAKWKIYVTKIGCGLAGFTEEQIAPLFAPVRNSINVWLPQSFIDIIDSMPKGQVYAKINKNGKTEIYGPNGELRGSQG